MRMPSLLLMILLAPATLSARQNSPVRALLIAAPAQDQSCPVNFSASRQSPLALLSANDGTPRRSGAGLRILFAPTDAPRILKASATVHGLSPAVRFLPVAAREDTNLTEDFQLERPAGAASLLQRSLFTARMSNVRWVELTHIDFADGTAWTASPGSRCHATPNGFLLVGNAR